MFKENGTYIRLLASHGILAKNFKAEAGTRIDFHIAINVVPPRDRNNGAQKSDERDILWIFRK